LPLRRSLAPPRYAAVPPAALIRFGVWLRPCGFRLRAWQVIRRTVLSRRRSAPCQPLRCLAGWATCLVNYPGGAHGILPFAAFFPSGRLWSLTTPLIPPAVRLNVHPGGFARGLAINTASSIGLLTRLPTSHSYDGQNWAMISQLPGFLPPDDPQLTVPSFHSEPRCRLGLCYTC